MYDIKYTSRVDNKVELIESYSYKNTTIPAGYVSDGLTIPIWFRLIVNKYSPKYLPCAFVHDFLTDEAVENYDDDYEYLGVKMLEKADSVFEEMLAIADGGKLSIKSKLMIAGVKVYHKIKYRV